MRGRGIYGGRSWRARGEKNLVILLGGRGATSSPSSLGRFAARALGLVGDVAWSCVLLCCSSACKVVSVSLLFCFFLPRFFCTAGLGSLLLVAGASVAAAVSYFSVSSLLI